MKNYLYLLAICILSLYSFTTCTKDADLPVYTMFDIEVNANVTKDYILLKGKVDDQGEGIYERGFVVKRTIYSTENSWDKNTIIQKYIVPEAEEAFEMKITDIMGDPADFEVYAYANIGGERKYRSESHTFQLKDACPTTIESVSIQTNDDHVTGIITLTGKNFSLFKFHNRLSTSEQLPGNIQFIPQENTSTKLTFIYQCHNIGEFELCYNKGENQIILDKKLVVEGTKFIGLNPESPQAGEWAEIRLESPVHNANYYFRPTKGVLDANYKQENGKWYVRFNNVSSKIIAHLCYDIASKTPTTYYPASELHFSSAWEYWGKLNPCFAYNSCIVGGTAYSMVDDIYCYTFKDKRLDIIPVDLFSLGFMPTYVNANINICVSDNYIYAFKEIHGGGSEDIPFSTLTLVLRMDLQTRQWEVHDRFPHPSNSASSVPTACKDFILISYSGDYIPLTIYYPEEKRAEVRTHPSNCRWLGEHKGYLYYLVVTDKTLLKRVKIDDWDSVELYADKVNGVISIHNDYFYIDNQKYLTRAKITDMSEEEILGAPYDTYLLNAYPTSDGIFATDYEGTIYRYIGTSQ